LNIADFNPGWWNLSQTLVWVTNDIGRIANHAKIMEIMDRLEHSPHGSDASMLRALNLLMQLQGPEGTVEVLRDGSQDAPLATIMGASVGGHWSAAHDALLHALSNGSVRIWGRKDGVAGSDFKTINSLDCCRIKFIEDRRGWHSWESPWAVYKDSSLSERGNEVFWDMLRFEAREILNFWPFKAEPSLVDLNALFREEANRLRRPLKEKEVIEIARNSGGNFSREEIRKTKIALFGRGKPGQIGPRKNPAAPTA
jgi:hypothetical protein